jgi:hypothetical protein
MEAGKPGEPGQPGGVGGTGGTGGHGGDPSGTGGPGGVGGTGGPGGPQKHGWMRATVVVWAVLVMSGLVGGTYILAHRGADNCDGIHRIVVALNVILADNDGRIHRAQQLGTLTSQQARESLAFNARARQRLDAADCK